MPSLSEQKIALAKVIVNACSKMTVAELEAMALIAARVSGNREYSNPKQ